MFQDVICAAAAIVGYALVAYHLTDWLLKRRRSRKQPKSGKHTLDFRLQGVNLHYEFDHPGARHWFLIGMREGVEQEVFALQRQKILPDHYWIDFGELTEKEE